MRLMILTAILALTAVPAMASSIEIISAPRTDADSIVTLSCSDCPAPIIRKDKSSYTVPTLADGMQRTEIRDIAGEKTLLRTEAWGGGSPVTFMSKAETWFPDQATAGNGDGVDINATTSAVVAGQATPVNASLEMAMAPRPLDLSDFQLRLE
ncbi:MAG: plant virulence effector HPE1-like domain-containing protein [Allorhizobium sp.]